MKKNEFIRDFRQFGVPWRSWMLLLQLVNLVAPLFFLGHREAWVVLAGYAIAALVILVMHRRLGWVRLLGVGHFVWLPMLPWLALRYMAADVDRFFSFWILSVLCVNGICLIIDSVDVLRDLKGDRKPVVSAAGR